MWLVVNRLEKRTVLVRQRSSGRTGHLQCQDHRAPVVLHRAFMDDGTH
jgi:hypothetical protein